MEFYTAISDNDFPKFELSVESQLLFLGSCFTERVGTRLARLGVQADVNPSGIAYNPISLCRLIGFAIQEMAFTENELIGNNDLWHHLHFHGDFSRNSADLTIEALASATAELRTSLQHAEVLFLSLGTANAFRHKASDQIVNNCHKVEASAFNRELLPLEEIVKVLKDTVTQVKSINPACQFVFTVSPVKHLRDGLVTNRRSKSILIEACHRVCEQAGAHYFPSYELLADQLRDYRFYDDDLAHPALVAVEIIFQKFLQQFFSEEGKDSIAQLEKVRSFIDHRPFNSESKAHQTAVEKQLENVARISKQYPRLRTQLLSEALSDSLAKV